MKTLIHDARGMKELLKNNKLLIVAMAVGVLILLIPWNVGEKKAAQNNSVTPEFELRMEEKRIEEALTHIEGAGAVKVLLTVDSTGERVYARDTDENLSGSDGDTYRSDKSSEVTNLSGEALTVRCDYPHYRGALIIVTGGSSAVRLQITQAVSALTGLSTDKITVLKGSF